MRYLLVLSALIFAVGCATAGSGAGQQTSNSTTTSAPETGRLLSATEIAGLDETDAKIQLAKQQEEEGQNRKDALDDFKKGAGLGISVALGQGQNVVDDAVVVDNKIVVTRRAKDQPRAAMEVHQLFTGNPFTANGRKEIREQIQNCADNSINCPLVGVGPFAAIQVGNDNSINSAGLGVMIGVRSDPRRGSSFNLGVGIVFDNHIKELAAGFEEGKALPTGETQIRFTERSSRRLMLTMSFAF